MVYDGNLKGQKKMLAAQNKNNGSIFQLGKAKFQMLGRYYQ